MNNFSFLEEITEQAKVKLDENIFKNVFIPLLFDPNPGAFNYNWLNKVAGNPHVRVYITDKTGKELFSVPPLKTSPTHVDGNKLQFTLNKYTQLSEMYGALALPPLQEGLANIFKFSNERDINHMKEWQSIFDRYGLSDKYIKTEDVNIVEDNQGISIVDDDEWD